jgi:hypothetical protein
MREVPDATRDLQVFWDDRFYQIVFWHLHILVFGLNVKTLPNWGATIILANSRFTHHASAAHSREHWIRGIQIRRWHNAAPDESSECTSGAFVIAPSAVTTLFRISFSIDDHSIATLSVRTGSDSSPEDPKLRV